MRGGGVDRGCGGVAGSVIDNHLAPVARAARVVPLLQWHVMGGRYTPVFNSKSKGMKTYQRSQIHTEHLFCQVTQISGFLLIT